MRRASLILLLGIAAPVPAQAAALLIRCAGVMFEGTRDSSGKTSETARRPDNRVFMIDEGGKVVAHLLEKARLVSVCAIVQDKCRTAFSAERITVDGEAPFLSEMVMTVGFDWNRQTGHLDQVMDVSAPNTGRAQYTHWSMECSIVGRPAVTPPVERLPMPKPRS